MRLVIDDEAKTIEMWFRNGENPDGTIPPEIMQVAADYRKRKYIICLYHSGKEDLKSLTSQLLIHNLKQMAASDYD